MAYDNEQNDEEESSDQEVDKSSDSSSEDPEHNNSRLIVFLGGLATVLGLSNIWLRYKNWKEKKRHLNQERLDKEAIQKHEAEIKDLSQKAEKADHLQAENEAMADYIKSHQNKGDKSDEQE